MLVARLGKGAVFATTMQLASSGQDELVLSLLNSHGRTDELPMPGGRADFLSQHALDVGLAIWSAVLAALSVEQIPGCKEPALSSSCLAGRARSGCCSCSSASPGVSWLAVQASESDCKGPAAERPPRLARTAQALPTHREAVATDPLSSAGRRVSSAMSDRFAWHSAVP